MFPKYLAWSYPLDDNYFYIPRLCLSLTGFYPETKQTWPVKCWAFVNFWNLCYCSLTSLYFGLLKFRTNVPEAFDAICPDASSVMSLVKMFCIWYYRDEFKILIERIRKLLQPQNSPEKLVVKRLYFSAATRLVFVVFFLGGMTAASYCLRVDITSIVRYLRGEPPMYETPYKTVFPDFAMHMPWFPVTFVCSHWYGFVVVFCFVAGDGLFCSFCFYITSLLKLLAFDLRDAFEGISGTNKPSQLEENEIYKKLANIIERYNEIADITAKFSDIMALLTLAQFVTSSMVIGISAVNLLLFPGYGIILYCFYVSCVTCESFLYCIGGTAVMESSEDLATVAYSTPWYNCSLKMQKTILTIMTRTQQCLIIKVPFFAPSLPVLTSILRTTGSLIALANSLM